ncbi:MAG: hypothetical protein ABIP19_05260 [Dermatophilaceae bacterium]
MRQPPTVEDFSSPVHHARVGVWAYRVTQGLHVVTGVACVPLLLAKMYAAYPRLFERPMVGSPLRMLERGSIAVLVAASLLQVTRVSPTSRSGMSSASVSGP